MRDIAIARRALLALAASFVTTGWRQPAASVRRHLPAVRKVRRIIALDAGHGGLDPGTISPHGIYEKTVNLATAQELARLLAATDRYQPVLTRRRDLFIPLPQRVALARAARAEVFLSIHADALPNTALRGLSVYTLSEKPSDRETAELASRENRDDFAAKLHLAREPREIAAILFDLARRHTANQSLMLAHSIVEELSRRVPLLERPQRSAAFVVLMAPDIPSALVELGCLSNPLDERLLPKPSYQRLLAEGLVRAIDDYFSSAAVV